MYSEVTSTNRTPFRRDRRASRQPSPNRPVLYASYDSSRLQRKVECFRGRRLEQSMRVVERAHKTLPLIVAAIAHNRTLGRKFLEIFVAPGEAASTHLGRWLDTRNRIARIDDQERTGIRTKKSRGMERLNGSLSAPISMFWPTTTKGGISGVRGPSSFAIHAPMWGTATDCGGS